MKNYWSPIKFMTVLNIASPRFLLHHLQHYHLYTVSKIQPGHRRMEHRFFYAQRSLDV